MKDRDKTKNQLINELTELRHLVETYHKSSESQWLPIILETLPVGVVLADSNGRIVRTNDMANKIWCGNSPISTIIDSKAYKAWWAESGTPLRMADWAMFRAIGLGEISKGEIINIQRFDGTKGTIINSASPCINQNGEVEGAVVVIQDATEQQLVNDLLKTAVNDLSIEEFSDKTLDTVLAMPFVNNKGTIYLVEEPDTLSLKSSRGIDDKLLLKQSPVNECTCRKLDENNQLQFVSGNECLYLSTLGLANHLCIPVVKGESLLGVISVSLKENLFQSKVCKEYLTAIANTLANFIVRKRAELELIQHRDNLQNLINEQTAELQDEIRERRLLEERFAIAFNASPSAMTISTLDGVYIDVNKSFERITGFTKETALGTTDDKLELWHNDSERTKLIKKLIKKGFYNNYEAKIQTHSRQIRTILASLEIIVINGLKHILTVFDDITEQKQFEKEMARLDRLSLIGQMAGGIGHEVRNPMTSVKGFLQLMASKETDSKKNEYYSIMIDELDRANSIITEFLSLAKDRIVNLKPASINTIISALYPLISTDAVKQDVLIALSKGNIPMIPLNEKEIRQLIFNLVRNGLEAMPSGGSMEINTYTKDNEVVLSVSDEGTGIKPEVLDKLGHPFVTTKDYGTGLGLAVCYSIANKHNAVIDVKTGPSGTTFFIRFRLPNTNTILTANEQVS